VSDFKVIFQVKFTFFLNKTARVAMYCNCCNYWARNFSSLFTLEHRANYCWPITAIDRVLECSAAKLQYGCGLVLPSTRAQPCIAWAPMPSAANMQCLKLTGAGRQDNTATLARKMLSMIVHSQRPIHAALSAVERLR